MAVRHRCLAVSRPRGVRVGLSAALRGPCEPVGVLQGTPGNPHSATSTPFSQRRWSRAVRRSGVRMDCNPRQPACSRRVAVPSRLSLPGADHRSRQQRQHAYHRTHDLGHSGPFTVVKRRRLAASGPRGVRVGRAAALRGPCKPAGYPEAPPEIRIVPVNVARQRRSHRHTRHRWPPRDSPRLLPNLEQQSDTGAPATTSYPPPHHASLTQIQAPSMQFPQPRWCTRHPEPATQGQSGRNGRLSPEYAATDHSATPRTYPHIHSATTPRRVERWRAHP